ncbi:MAG TPA: phosphate signaling complex protein PhoU [Verrucomicrobiales bacterium]|nr:phosphate signaling complex protein PhoU [Verrucomicrobiales bacterium]
MRHDGPRDNRAGFDAALGELQQSILMMASLAERNLSHAMRGLLHRDLDLCNRAVDEDADVDRLEKVVDREGLQILIAFQPNDYQVRKVTATMRVSNNLERISDQAVTVARFARDIVLADPLPLVQLIEPLYDMAQIMMKRALSAFIEGDVDLALAVTREDSELDAHHHRLIARIKESLAQGSAHAPLLLNLFVIVRALERVGDHAVNVAEDSVFIEKGTDIRHGGREDLE